mmetsp:Transcript_12415/g.26854  ORF Transcript_12415/g.26854 Transcript_12415/m.26854 type:complete len:236 (-) Transcript_12415:2868-3575(-)
MMSPTRGSLPCASSPRAHSSAALYSTSSSFARSKVAKPAGSAPTVPRVELSGMALRSFSALSSEFGSSRRLRLRSAGVLWWKCNGSSVSVRPPIPMKSCCSTASSVFCSSGLLRIASITPLMVCRVLSIPATSVPDATMRGGWSLPLASQYGSPARGPAMRPARPWLMASPVKLLICRSVAEMRPSVTLILWLFVFGVIPSLKTPFPMVISFNSDLRMAGTCSTVSCSSRIRICR